MTTPNHTQTSVHDGDGRVAPPVDSTPPTSRRQIDCSPGGDDHAPASRRKPRSAPTREGDGGGRLRPDPKRG
jgi:hypothetical protein